MLTLYQRTNFWLNSSKLKEFADDRFKFDENGEKFSKRGENTARKGREDTVGKVEIACYEQFLRFPPLKDLCFRHVKTGASLGKGLW